MIAAGLWAPVVPRGAYVINGIIYFPEQEEEEEAFEFELLSRHPDCVAIPMHEKYARLYDAHGEERAEAFLHEISNQLTSKTLSLGASDEEINAFARKLADQFFRLQRGSQVPLLQPRFSAISLTRNMVLSRQGRTRPVKRYLHL